MYNSRITRILPIIAVVSIAAISIFWTLASIAHSESHAVLTVCVQGPPSCGFTTIQNAIDSQPFWAEVRVAQGTYSGVYVRPRYDTEVSGVVTQMVYVKDKIVTLRGGYAVGDFEHSYPITRPTILDAQGQGRVIYAVGYSTIDVEGLHIVNGTSQYHFTPGNYSGGGIFAMTGTVRLSGNWFEKNGAYTYGGAMYLLNTTSTITNNTIDQNSAGGKGGQGGGVAISGGSTDIVANQIYSNSAHWIGGVALYGVTATLQSNVITGNSSIAVGGISIGGGVAKLTGNLIQGNYADVNYGPGGTGGIQISGATATLIGNTINGNTINGDIFVGSGAGLQISSSDVFMDYNTITNNRVTGPGVFVKGGGLYSWASAITLTHNLIANNVASVGGGVYIDTITNGASSRISPPSALLSTNQFIGNRAHYGAAAYVAGPDQVRFVNTVFADNLIDSSPITASYFYPRLDVAPTGSVFFLYESNPKVLHATMDHNTGGDGTAISGNGSIALTNTIFVRHAIGINLSLGYAATLNSTLWGNTVNISGSSALVSAGNVFGDPHFVDAAAHDYHLLPNSDAINRGTNTDVYVDIDGQPRPIGDKSDLGVDEYLAATPTRTPAPTATSTPSPTPPPSVSMTPSLTPSATQVTATPLAPTPTHTPGPTPSKTFTPLPPEPPAASIDVFLPMVGR